VIIITFSISNNKLKSIFFKKEKTKKIRKIKNVWFNNHQFPFSYSNKLRTTLSTGALGGVPNWLERLLTLVVRPARIGAFGATGMV
jgi:hypothetical protein